MTQDERWMARYNEIVAFIEREHRNPSKYYPEERGKFCNWLKHNKKLYNNGELKEERIEKFRKLLELTGQYRRKNQYHDTESVKCERFHCMSEEKKDMLVQNDESGVISPFSSLANIKITTKDNPVTSVLNFSALSTKMSEICRRKYVPDGIATLTSLANSTILGNIVKPQDTIMGAVLGKGQVNTLITEPTKLSVSPLGSAISSLTTVPKELFEPKISVLSALEKQTSIIAHDMGIPKITSVASQISSITGMLSAQTKSIQELIAPSLMLSDLQKIAIDTHQSIINTGVPSEWKLGVVDSASFLVDRQVDWASQFCSSVYGERPLVEIGDLDGLAPKVNFLSFLEIELDGEKKKKEDIKTEDALAGTNVYKVTEKGKRLINKVVNINKLCERTGKKPLFKYTGATTKAAASMGGTLCSTQDEFGIIIDGLYDFFYENLSRIKDVVPDEVVRNDAVFQCIFRVKNIRTDLRHDYEHGSDGDIRKANRKIGDSYSHYAGRPVLLSSSDFMKVQDGLYNEFDVLADYLTEIVINNGEA